jgi:hypothetical protein
MNKHTDITEWATQYLNAQGYQILQPPEIVLETPFSIVFRFSTSTGVIYLKQTPPSITFCLESKITQLLADEFHASVPTVIGTNEKLHCFLTKDAGLSLRAYLKNSFEPELLLQAIKQFTAIQRMTEKHVNNFIGLGVPDWRLDKIPPLYDELINQKELLKMEGMTEEEMKLLHQLSGQIIEKFQSLSQYHIPEAVVQSDFHTNNILIDAHTKKLTFIDLGEIVITHPFFSLHTFLNQAITHHGLKEQDPLYDQLQKACLENWLELGSAEDILNAFQIAKTLWPIYSALIMYRFMNSLDPAAFKSYSANKPHKLAGFLREYSQERGQVSP